MKRNERRAPGLFILDGVRTRDLSPQYKRAAEILAGRQASRDVPGAVWGHWRILRFQHAAAHEKALLKGH